MSASVWVIEHGEYDDYRVLGVFSTKENAERVLAAFGKADSDDLPTIAEWPLDPGVAELAQGYTRWDVWMLRDGSVRNVSPGAGGSVMTAFRAWDYSGIKGGRDALEATAVWAKTAEHAVKIVDERRLHLIAQNWPT